MGEKEVVEESNSENIASNEPDEIVYGHETDEEEDSETNDKQSSEGEKREDELSNTKKNPDNLRKVIKVGSSDETDNKEPQKEKKGEPIEDDLEPITRESLEQKRAILQSIKDFDFQIKKNQEELTLLNRKVDNVVKDLDDLVSLYEIVSEQMNPFVGLSKVTKKRIDALENFTKEIDLLKERTNELESFAERSGVKLKKSNINEFSKEKENLRTNPNTNGIEDIKEEELDNEISIELSTEEGEEPISINLVDNGFSEFSDSDWDYILDRAFEDMFPESKIDMIIDEFIESLKG